MFQIVVTPSAGKRLIAQATVAFPAVQNALKMGTIVVVAGTTNGYIAEKLLSKTGQAADFNRKRFVRGVTVPPRVKTTETGRLPDESQFPGDVVLVNGQWQKGKTIFDVLDTLKAGDIIIKGANCLDPVAKKAAVLIGHPQGGTIVAALQAIVGRRVQMIIPVGLEKRVSGDIDSIARLLNDPRSAGSRLLPLLGEIISEIEAIDILFGLKATLVAAGGVCGAEGAVWLAIEGEREKEENAKKMLDALAGENPFSF